MNNIDVNPELDLVLERRIATPRSHVWTAWTKAEHVEKWLCPAPWAITDCNIDLRPGGVFHFVMRGPEGQTIPNQGCYLDVQPEHRLVWTDTLLPGYRPSESPFFTAVIELEEDGDGTLYRAIALHKNKADRIKHEEMGFSEGWGKSLDQLVELTSRW